VELIHTVAELRKRLGREPSVVLVPTMGNLHAGHISLVDLAHKHGRCVVATIFVNRLQFEPGSDFERYPRTLERDAKMLEAAGCHVAFAPDEREMYPRHQEITLAPPKVAHQLDGDFRPGHFQGVVTVVAKLFNIVKPHAAVFGKKDYQQLRVLQELERQLNFGIEIVPAETVRESDGLAMSSRNGYLSAEERTKAPQLQRELKRIREAIEGGSHRFDRHCEVARGDLSVAGWNVDYVEVRTQAELATPNPHDTNLVVLAAAWLGKTRLIDNVEVTAHKP